MNFYFYSWTLALMISGIVIPGGKLQEEIGKEIEVESDFLLFQNKAEEICWFEIGRWESGLLKEGTSKMVPPRQWSACLNHGCSTSSPASCWCSWQSSGR